MNSAIPSPLLASGKPVLPVPQAAPEPTASPSGFTRWLDQHLEAASQPAAPPTPSAPGAPAQTRQLAARAEANALAARRQALATKAPAPQGPARQSAPPAAKPAQGAQAAESARSEATKGASKVACRDGQDDAAAAADTAGQADATESPAQDVAAASAPSDPTLTGPPSGPGPGQAADASNLFAWLASLAHAHAPAHAAQASQDTGAEAGSEAASSSGVLAWSGQDTATLDRAAAGESRARAPSAAPSDPALLAAQRLTATPDELRAGGDTAPAAGAGAFADALSSEALRGAGLSGHFAHAAPAHGASPAASDTLATPLHSPDFAQALAERVSLWVKSTGEGGTLTAELHLNPAEMGPISVKIALDGQSARVDFAAATLETRRAIESSLPQLSSALDEVGLKLGGSGVSDQPAQQQFAQQPEPGAAARSWGVGGSGLNAATDSSGPESIRQAVRVGPNGLRGGLDLYA